MGVKLANDKNGERSSVMMWVGDGGDGVERDGGDGRERDGGDGQ